MLLAQAASTLIARSDKEAPKVWQAREQSVLDEYDAVTGDTFAAVAAAVGTDFSQWSEAEVRAFLEQRGEDYDDCSDMAALVSWHWMAW